jgi:hypothetical protein
MAGLTRDEFDQAAKEIQAAWNRADSKEAGFQVIVDLGRKYGYKNVIAAIQGRLPKQYTREQPVDKWVEARRQEESEV